MLSGHQSSKQVYLTAVHDLHLDSLLAAMIRVHSTFFFEFPIHTKVMEVVLRPQDSTTLKGRMLPLETHV